MTSFQQILSDMNPANYTYNGEPATFYGLVAVTTLVLGYVTAMESVNNPKKSSTETAPPSPEETDSMIPVPGMMPIPVETEPVVEEEKNEPDVEEEKNEPDVEEEKNEPVAGEEEKNEPVAGEEKKEPTGGKRKSKRKRSHHKRTKKNMRTKKNKKSDKKNI